MNKKTNGLQINDIVQLCCFTEDFQFIEITQSIVTTDVRAGWAYILETPRASNKAYVRPVFRNYHESALLKIGAVNQYGNVKHMQTNIDFNINPEEHYQVYYRPNGTEWEICNNKNTWRDYVPTKSYLESVKVGQKFYRPIDGLFYKLDTCNPSGNDINGYGYTFKVFTDKDCDNSATPRYLTRWTKNQEDQRFLNSLQLLY